uniref:Vacuolar protein n=1 Tax=Rhodnius prolixus TaxID=13249 RepID=T1HAM6_RHOPR
MVLILPPCPASLKQIQHYLKAATEHETRDPVVSYWCRLFALQTALKIDKKSDEAKVLLVKLMDWLEMEKKAQSNNEAITNDIAAQAHVENYSLKLFMWADEQDRNGVFNKNVVKAFYTAGVLMDVLSLFGEQSEDIVANCKYAKWKAAYIHNCLKNGETPIPGPVGENPEDNVGASGSSFVPGTNSNEANESITSEEKTPNEPASNDIEFAKFPAGPPAPTEITQPVMEIYNPDTPTPSNVTTLSEGLMATVTGVKLDPSQVTKAQKYCKFAASALNYDDVGDAVNYLHKALRLLETGQDS